MRRIVITGLGVVTPVGHTVKEAWQNILEGKSGIGLIEHFDTSAFSSRIGGSIRDFDLSPYMSPKEARKTDPFIHYGIAAAMQAIEDAGVEVTDANAERIGIAIGSGIGGLPGIEKGYDNFLKGGPRKISPFFVPSNIINMIAGNLSIKYGIKGPNYGIQGSELRHCHRVLHGNPQHRGCGAHDRAGRRGCHDRRRLGDGDLADRPGRLRVRAGAVHAQRRARARQPAVGQGARRIRAR